MKLLYLTLHRTRQKPWSAATHPKSKLKRHTPKSIKRSSFINIGIMPNCQHDYIFKAVKYSTTYYLRRFLVFLQLMPLLFANNTDEKKCVGTSCVRWLSIYKGSNSQRTQSELAEFRTELLRQQSFQKSTMLHLINIRIYLQNVNENCYEMFNNCTEWGTHISLIKHFKI